MSSSSPLILIRLVAEDAGSIVVPEKLEKFFGTLESFKQDCSETLANDRSLIADGAVEAHVNLPTNIEYNFLSWIVSYVANVFEKAEAAEAEKSGDSSSSSSSETSTTQFEEWDFEFLEREQRTFVELQRLKTTVTGKEETDEEQADAVRLLEMQWLVGILGAADFLECKRVILLATKVIAMALYTTNPDVITQKLYGVTEEDLKLLMFDPKFVDGLQGVVRDNPWVMS
jgi:hypothetical protein